ncbi:FAD-dependent oxidoreductase [Lapidilactobacillus achengensis]|uniref:FAD-dependent oxidoreductase n=1 Tax=Lapidilactobacillus achengensis TaxID=2486000 RepID=A0ABW1UNS3_9LACO|nr:FAD-dependent oxidoreductase [Lapidilactobacillus achengensis]
MKVVIVGCTHAGTIAAAQILKTHPETEVTIYERNDDISFLSCGIYLYLGGKVKNLEDMFYSSPEELQQQGADIRTHHNVLSINTVSKRLRAVNIKTGEMIDDSYDKLIMCTGSTAAVPPLSGIDESKVLLCKNFQQAQEIYETAQHNHRIAVIGAGYSGTEITESYAQTNHEVLLLTSGAQVMHHYIGPEISAKVTELLEAHQVEIHLNQRVSEFTSDEKGDLLIKTMSGEAFSADLAIVCTGFVPSTTLLRNQVQMDRHGALLTNKFMQTSNPDIYAAGDSCAVRFNPTGRPAYTPLATNAIRQAVLAATNIFGNTMPYMGTQATSALQLFDYSIATTGLTYKYALRNGFKAQQIIYEDTWRPTYMPTTDKIKIVLIYDQETRRILGCQLISKHEIAQSANTISLAIQNDNTIDDLAYVDMLFQPNFDYPFNYLNLAAQKAIDQEREAGRDNPRFTALGNDVPRP